MIYDVLVGAQRVRVNGVLTYESSETIAERTLIIVPLRDQTVLGVVVRPSTSKPKGLKQITTILPYRLTTQQLGLLRWMEQYYPAPLSAIVHLFLPPARITGTEATAATATKTVALPALTKEQQLVVDRIQAGNDTNYLLHGITGSGKTRVYAELVKQSLSTGKSVLVLTPEIGLTTPLDGYFRKVFGDENVTAFHSGLTPKERAERWAHIAAAPQPQIVIGPRSALFLPLKDIGLIIVDEAHDGAYKQEQQPFYHATRVAAKLASLSQAKCVLGSATPLVADYYAFASKQLPILELTETAIRSDYKRTDHIIDLKDRSLFQRSQLISTPLLSAIGEALKSGKQALLFLNRRGSARTVLCQNCGWQDLCPRCDISLTYHSDTLKVICHTCGYNKSVSVTCPVCNGVDILFQTPGTKSIEAEISRLFPEARVGRYDKDSSAGSKLHQSFDAIHRGDIDILVGTQLLAKGLDLPRLAVIGLVQADSSMSIPDFSAAERSYQQISQVAGRLGRGHGDGDLYLQTYQPDRPLYEWALKQDYKSFYEAEIAERLQFGFPPATYLLVLQAKRATQKGAIKALERLSKQLEEYSGLQIEAPAPCFHEKRAGQYYWQVVVRSKQRSQLTDIIAKLPAQISYNIDPTDLL